MKKLHDILTSRAGELINAKGYVADPKELEALARRLKPPLFDRLTYWRLPVCDVLFQFAANSAGIPQPPSSDFMEDYDADIGHGLVWMPPEHVLFELTEAVAGPPAFQAGFLPIGHCVMGGDGYFIRYDQATGWDVPLYQVYYDWIDPDAPVPVPEDALHLVSHSLAEVIAVASILRS